MLSMTSHHHHRQHHHYKIIIHHGCNNMKAKITIISIIAAEASICKHNRLSRLTPEKSFRLNVGLFAFSSIILALRKLIDDIKEKH